MKDLVERFAVLPFSLGCVSHTSVSVVETQPKKIAKGVGTAPPTGGEETSEEKQRSFSELLPLPKPAISTGLQRLIKGIRSFSHFFVYKEGEIGEMKMEMEMEIGVPTDVKHVTHIGWDGLATTATTTFKGWDDFKPPELLSLPSISLKLAMAAQTDGHLPNSSAVRLA